MTSSLTTKVHYGYATPSAVTLLMFFLIFSGPPKLRLRDPISSLHGIIDWSIALQIAVWLCAGVWVVYNLLRFKNAVAIRFSVPEQLGLLLVVLLGISATLSAAPAMSAFKVYQLLITILFTSLFVRCYGVRSCLEALFWCTTILCVADVIAAICAPRLVFVISEVGGERFRGDLIAQTGVVSVLGLILLLTRNRKMSRMGTMTAYFLFAGVLGFSLMRTAYIVVIAIAVIAVVTRPAVRRVRRFSWVVLTIVPVLAFVGLGSTIDKYRPSESVWTLSDRTGLWTYLANTTWTKSPFFGLGYYAASRIYSLQYNPELGTAHSGFVEVFVGGGVASSAVCLAIWGALGWYVLRWCSRGLNRRSFTLVALFASVFAFILVGGGLEAEPAGFAYWCLVAIMPIVWRQEQSWARCVKKQKF